MRYLAKDFVFLHCLFLVCIEKSWKKKGISFEYIKKI